MSTDGERRVQVVRPVRREPADVEEAPSLRKFKLKSTLARMEARVRRTEQSRPRFVTTVRSGQFLLPPPAFARLLGLEALYPSPKREPLVFSYSSRPQPVANTRRDVPKSQAKPVPTESQVQERTGEALAGVRALVAGVAGMTRLLDNNDGSVGSGGTTHYSNLMHDKRVVRGSTFATHPNAAGDGGPSAAARARRRARKTRTGTPPPAPGRRHHPIQTEYFLEELFDKGVEMEIGVQTDLFVDRPPTPVYVPAKTGADAYTQIYPGDLFDFDLEVQPILEVLVGKTADQALAEVAQEEELCTLREQQRRYRELRDAERAERQRLAAADLRLNHEKERRVAEARVAQEAATQARERAAAATLVQGYVAELLPSVLAGLHAQGYLVERIERGVEEEFMPWLVKEVSQEIESLITSRDVLTEIVRDVMEARAELHRAAGEQVPLEPPPDSITPATPDLEEESLEEHNQN